MTENFGALWERAPKCVCCCKHRRLFQSAEPILKYGYLYGQGVGFPVKPIHFEWDEDKDRANQEKHGVSFQQAQHAFSDAYRVIAKDVEHSHSEDRFYCFGMVNGGVLTVRFTYRDGMIRIYGAGYWRKGKAIYERENKIHR
jgi:uncharacterized DUF497 family protein